MSGLPIKKEIRYYYGDSLSGVEAVWQDADGDPIDLTGFLASMQVKDADGELLLALDSAGDSDGEGGLTIVEEEGKVIVNAPAPQMMDGSLVPREIYDYDLQVKSEDGNTVRTLMSGKFSVYAQVTEV